MTISFALDFLEPKTIYRTPRTYEEKLLGSVPIRIPGAIEISNIVDEELKKRKLEISRNNRSSTILRLIEIIPYKIFKNDKIAINIYLLNKSTILALNRMIYGIVKYNKPIIVEDFSEKVNTYVLEAINNLTNN